MRTLGLNVGDGVASEDGMDRQSSHRGGLPVQIKSGKLATITSRVRVAEKWPHSFLGRQFIGVNKQYEELSLAEFCAGYTGILREEVSASVLAFRMEHLEHLMYFATIYSWSCVLRFHAAVLVEIEKGVRKWGDDTRHLEAMTLVHQRQEPKKKEVKSRSASAKPLFCALYQGGSCPHPGDHEGTINGRSCFLRHICAKCLQSFGTTVSHGDKSASFPLKNPPPSSLVVSSASGGAAPPVSG